MKCFFTYTEYYQKVKRRKSIDFLKGTTNHIQLRAIFAQNKGKTRKNISLMFSSYRHYRPGDPQPDTLNL